MSISFRECAETVRRLHAAVAHLERAAELLQLPPLAGREWYELLRRKLLPQLHDDAFLVVAVVGGTNIGKSVIFNHLAGFKASATSPLASGTKHPVCLVPPGFADRHDLTAIFDGFILRPWTAKEEALEETPEHRLFWKTSDDVPENLLVLDTPDIDSDARVNWERADNVRRCADILIAVLTQQKYNDAAVKQFFRKAAAEDKAVIVVFNQCQLPEDEQYWPLWLDTFCGETDIRPEILYIAPSDRRAAEENRLSFFERCWPVVGRISNPSAENPPAGGASWPCDGRIGNPSHGMGRNLAEDLSRLRFHAIKFRTLRGSLRQMLDRGEGIPAYLSEVEQRSADFKSAADRLSSESVVKVRDWPVAPNALLVGEIRQWWRTQQEGWARRVHSFYDTIGQGVMWPLRFARDRIQGEPMPPMDLYRQQEWSTILRAVEEVFEKLTWMSESGSDLLQPHFERLLAGKSRVELLEMLRREHATAPLDRELEDVVKTEMRAFQTGSPELYKFYKQLNNISAAVRPMTSVVLFSLGWGPAGELVAPFVANAAGHAVVHIVADFAGGATTAVAGETAVSKVAGEGAGLLQAKFQRLQAAFTARRVAWLVRLLKEQLLGTLPEDLQAAAAVPGSETFQTVQRTLEELETQLAAEPQETIA